MCLCFIFIRWQAESLPQTVVADVHVATVTTTADATTDAATDAATADGDRMTQPLAKRPAQVMAQLQRCCRLVTYCGSIPCLLVTAAQPPLSHGFIFVHYVAQVDQIWLVYQVLRSLSVGDTAAASLELFWGSTLL